MIYAVGTGRAIANAASPRLGRRFEDQSEGWASRFADRVPVSPGRIAGEEPVPGMACGEVGLLGTPSAGFMCAAPSTGLIWKKSMKCATGAMPSTSAIRCRSGNH